MVLTGWLEDEAERWDLLYRRHRVACSAIAE